MKRKLTTAGCIVLAVQAIAQPNWSGSTPGTGWNALPIRVGGASNPGAGTTLHVGDGAGTLHYTNDGGLMIKSSNPFGRALAELEDAGSNNKLVLQSLGGASYIDNLNSTNTGGFASPNTKPIYMQSNGGNIGIGTTSVPNKLTVSTSALNDGILVRQTTTGASALHLDNLTTGGQHWALFSFGTGNPQGSGNFSIHQYGTGDRLFIRGSDGHVGINSTNMTMAHFEVKSNMQAGVSRAGFFDAIDPWGLTYSNVGVYGLAGSDYNCSSINYGVVGRAVGPKGSNTGGFFEGLDTPCSTGAGIIASGNMAGVFLGPIEATAYLPSDKQLKDNIRPITNAMDKISRLKPSTYVYKVNDFKDMNLPQGQQLGLIAQELEEVFPELIREMKEIVMKDDKGGIEKNVAAHKSVNYTGLIPVLIASMQELNARMNQQELEIARLNTELAQVKQAGTSGIGQLNGLDLGFRMSQNEPNPFTHETVVKYSLPQNVSKALMMVYDLSGKQISSITLDQKGDASVTITSEKLAAGMYIYSIVADGKVMDSKRMIVAEK